MFCNNWVIMKYSQNIHDLSLTCIFEIVYQSETKQEELKNLIQFINEGPIELVKEKINQYLSEHETSLLGYSAKYSVPLFKAIISRMPASNLDFTKLSSSYLHEIPRIIYNDADFYLKKLNNTNLDWNAICNPYGCTVFQRIINKFPDIMLQVLQNITLETINFNVSLSYAYMRTPLALILKNVVYLDDPCILDTLLDKAPFRNLDFKKAGIYHAKKGQFTNAIDWLSNTNFAPYINKIFEIGIKQGLDLYNDLYTKTDSQGNIEQTKIETFQKHIHKLEDFVKMAKIPALNIKLFQFYEELGLSKKLLVYQALYPLVENADVLSNTNKDKGAKELLKVLNYILDSAKPALRKQLRENFASAQTEKQKLPLQSNNICSKLFENPKTPVIAEKKNSIFPALNLNRDREALTKCYNNNKNSEHDQTIELSNEAIHDVEKRVTALTI